MKYNFKFLEILLTVAVMENTLLIELGLEVADEDNSALQ